MPAQVSLPASSSTRGRGWSRAARVLVAWAASLSLCWFGALSTGCSLAPGRAQNPLEVAGQQRGPRCPSSLRAGAAAPPAARTRCHPGLPTLPRLVLGPTLLGPGPSASGRSWASHCWPRPSSTLLPGLPDAPGVSVHSPLAGGSPDLVHPCQHLPQSPPSLPTAFSLPPLPLPLTLGPSRAIL